MKSIATKMMIFSFIMFITASLTGMAVDKNFKNVIPSGGQELSSVRPLVQPDNIQQDMKYLIFANMDAPEIITYAYTNIIAETEFADEFGVASFSDEFFENNNITDFDVVIFPTGNFLLNASTEGGIRVIDVAKELLDSGKNVAFMSRLGLEGAYNTGEGDDPDVKEFLEDDMGINYLGMVKLVANNQYQGYVARGAAEDPVSLGFRKWCNLIFEGDPPLVYYQQVQVFKNRNKSEYQTVDHFVRDDEDNPNDTLLGIRANVSEGKAVFWSYGFENLCQNKDIARNINGAMRWFLKGAPEDGPVIAALESKVKFGNVEVGNSETKTVVITNDGSEDLIIDNIFFYEWVDAGIYDAVDGLPNTPLTIKPGSFYNIEIKFTPAEETTYREFLAFESNAVNTNELGVQLEGFGGQAGAGAQIYATKDTIDFGEHEPLQQVYEEVSIENTGSQEMIVNIIDIDYLGAQDTVMFQFVSGSSVPKILQPGESHTIKMRFVPQKENEEYEAELVILSTARNTPQLRIPMIGRGKEEAGSVREFSGGMNGLTSMKAYPNPFDEITKIEYEISGETPKKIAVKVFDNSGKFLRTLDEGLKSPGKYSIDFIPSTASGTYHVVLEIDGRKAEMPVYLVK